MKPLADYLEARNALLYSLRDHDEDLRRRGEEPGNDRAIIVGMLEDMSVEAWKFNEEPWIR